jgi:hypothetical protein
MGWSLRLVATIFGGETELFNLTAVQKLVKRPGHLEQGNRVNSWVTTQENADSVVVV